MLSWNGGTFGDFGYCYILVDPSEFRDPVHYGLATDIDPEQLPADERSHLGAW